MERLTTGDNQLFQLEPMDKPHLAGLVSQSLERCLFCIFIVTSASWFLTGMIDVVTIGRGGIVTNDGVCVDFPLRCRISFGLVCAGFLGNVRYAFALV